MIHIDMMTVTLICTRLNITRTTLNRWIDNTRNNIPNKPHFPLPCFVIGKRRIWQTKVVNAWLDNTTDNGTAVVDFTDLVPMLIQDAKRVHTVYGGIDDDLAIFIVGETYTTCNKLRAMFPEGAGNVLAKSKIRIYFVTDDTFEADTLKMINGRTALRCIQQNDYVVGNTSIRKALKMSLMLTTAATERATSKLILHVAIQ